MRSGSGGGPWENPGAAQGDAQGMHPCISLTVGPHQVPTMPLEAARDLSIPDLLHVLREKLSLECARLREAGLAPVFSTASLGPEVSISRSVCLDERGSEVL